MQRIITSLSSLSTRWFTAGAVIILFLVSIWLYILMYAAPPSIALGSDAGNILSFIAAREHEDIFASDPVLGDLDNFRFYYTIHFPIIVAIAQFTGDYGSAMYYTLFPHIFFQLIGFYFLGRVLLKRQLSAILLALASLPTYWIGLGELWGAFGSPIPRITFQMLMPYLLALAIYWRQKPSRWVWLMIFAGLLIYVHPVSAPAFGFAIWVGLAVSSGVISGVWRRIAALLGLGGVFLLVTMPFVVFYISNTNTTADATTFAYTDVYPLLVEKFGNYLDMPAAIGAFRSYMVGYIIYPISLIAMALWYWLGDKKQRGNVIMLAGWLIGIVTASMVVQSIQQIIERQYEILPVQIDLIRGMRYLVAIGIIAIVGAISILMSRAQDRRTHAVLWLIQFGLIYWMWYSNPPAGVLYERTFESPLVECFPALEASCLQGEGYGAQLTALDYIREETDPTATRVFSLRDKMSLRYYALRTVVYTDKDANVLGYANPVQMEAWADQKSRVDRVRNMDDTLEKLKGTIDLAQEFGATHIFWQDGLIFPSMNRYLNAINAQIVFESSGFYIIELPPDHVSVRGNSSIDGLVEND